MYVKRDENGQIVAISAVAETGFEEQLDSADPQLTLFVDSIQQQSVQATEEVRQLRSSDVELARVVEDIINLLTDKGVIQFTELPEAAQQKLLQRKSLRRHIQHLDLVADDDNEQLML
ncbi:MAG: tryptophan synthase subunit beta like protein [Wenzhouxiangella sp.]